MTKSIDKTYSTSGVDTQRIDIGLSALLKSIGKTSLNRPRLGRELVPNGYYASVLDLGSTGLAVATDGVGTKIVVAEMMERYDTIGIDLIAMNVNDIICVGAEPVALLDYIAIEEPHLDLLAQLGKGLLKGANESGISIPAGEIAQVKDLIKGVKPGRGFDLVGTSVGVVDKKKIIVGQNVRPGDVMIGLKSSGLHSNGYTLARKVLLSGKRKITDKLPGSKRSIGEEMLTPTRLYVKGVLELLKRKVNVKALNNITGDGLLNLCRIKKQVKFVVESLPKDMPVFSAIKQIGKVADEEMYTVFNMGIGFVVTVAKKDFDKSLSILKNYKYEPFYLGHIAKADGASTVHILEKGLVGSGKMFTVL